MSVTTKDADLTLRYAFDDATNSFRVVGSFTSINPANGDTGAPVPTQATQVGGENPSGDLEAIKVDSSGNLLVSLDSSSPVHVIVDSSALPTGASTAANQATEIASLASIDSKLTSPLSVTGPLTNTELRASPVPVSASALPLPSGAATSANQATEIASLASIDTKLTSPLTVSVNNFPATQPVSGTVTVTQATGTNLHAVIDSSALPSGAATSVNQVTELASLASIDSKLTSPLTVTGPLTDTQLRASPVPVSASALPLPSGAATAALQTSGNASLSSVDSKLGTLGQKTMAGSAPVVLASDQSAIPVTMASVPTGAATAANQATEIASLASIDTKLTSPLAVTGPLTDTQLRAVAVPVSGTVTVTQATGTNLHAVVDSSALPTGAATSANQVTELASLASIDGKLNSLGQKTSANSVPVVLSSDQSSLPTTQAGYTKSNTPNYNIYSSSPVTTGAYVQLVASLTSAVKQLQIFDSSGQAMIIATGAAAAEVDQIYIPPGGGVFNLAIPAATRVSIKALTANASTGYLLVDYLG